jgi:hypothetical protein
MVDKWEVERKWELKGKVSRIKIAFCALYT